jgi:signal transduction histidine kinase/ligand-binding sensor domain-containing protein
VKSLDFKPEPAARAFPYNIYPAETFHRDRDGNIWYIDQNQQLALFSTNGHQKIPAGLQLPHTQVTALAIDARGILWIATTHQIVSWNGQEIEDHTPKDTTGLSDVQQIAFSGDGGLWVCERYQLRKLLNGAWTATADADLLRASISSRFYRLYGDSRGGAWIVSYGHGLLHAGSDGATQRLTKRDGLPSDSITCWLEDKEGNVWVGTTGSGIARIRPRIFQTLGLGDGLPEKMVRSVAVDADGDVWAGTVSGQLAQWRGGKCTVFPLPPVDPTPLGGITIWPSRAGQVWVGGLYYGLRQIENGQITRPVAGAGLRFIRVFFEDSQNRLWIGGLGALHCYVSGKLKHFGVADGFPASVAIGAIAEDASGAIWIGTGTGDLWRYQNNQFTCFHTPAEWSSCRFAALQADANGVVWAGTLGNGLLRFQNGHFTSFRTQEGLPDDNVTQLLDDGNGNLWGGTYAGIFRVKKRDLDDFAESRTAKLVCSAYSQSDGLPALECTGGFNPACWRADDGRLWFSTVNGLVSVNPSAVHSNHRPPEVIIEELHVDGKLRPLNAEEQSGRAALQIEPGRHFLQFRFTGLSFRAPDKVRFRWKLDGIDQDWQDSGTQRVIGCGPLSPGDYRLRVRACNSDGVWNDEDTTLAFTVLPHFWETWWFKVAALIGSFAVMAMLVLLWLRRRYRRKLERVQRQHEIERERARIARDLHDDLGTSLTQISVLSSLANREQTKPDKARQLIEQIGGRSQAMVTALDEIVWAVNPQNDSLAALVNYLGHFTEELLLPADIRCRLNLPNNLPPHPLSAEVRHNLFLAFKEALNNCVRHSGASQVRLSVELKPAEVVMRLEDNGKGFVAGTETIARRGNGLANIQKRMEQIGGVAEIQSAVGNGATVILRLPLVAPVAG